MSTEPSSLEGAILDEMGEDGVRGPLGGALPSQLDAFRDADTGHLPANVFQLVRQAEGEAVRSGRGRPRGARNKRSADLAKLITHKYGDPVEAMASLYAMPLDHLCELVFVADGTIARQNRLDEILEGLTDRMRELARVGVRNGEISQSIDRLADACEALESAARSRAAKPGDVPIKALNIQLAAAKAVAEYVHSRMPTKQEIKTNADAIIVMPGSGGAGGFEELDADTRRAAEIIGAALTKGQIQAADLAGLRLVDNQLVDAEFTPADEEEGA